MFVHLLLKRLLPACDISRDFSVDVQQVQNCCQTFYLSGTGAPGPLKNMNQPDQNYDIHEKISQLETELLQHELLIRRQKHVINSLKQIISPASPAGGAPTAGSVVRGANSTQNARAPLSQAAQILATLPSTTSVSGRNPAPAATVARAPAVQTTARSVPTVSNIRGPAVRQKKRSALAKVRTSYEV